MTEALETVNAPVPSISERWTSLDWLWAALPLCLGMIFIVLPQSNYFGGIPGGKGDPRFNSVILEHVYQWSMGQVPELWSPRFFYPFPGTLAFSDNHFGSAPIYIACRLLGLDRYDAFTAWFTVASPLNFLACLLVLRAMGFSAFAAGAGAFVFTFALPVTAQVGHAQLLYRFAVPPAMLAAHRLIQRRDLRQVNWLALWVTVQFYCTIYVGFFLLLLLLAWAMVLGLLKWRRGAGSLHGDLIAAVQRADIRDKWLVAGAIAVASLALLYLLGSYKWIASSYGFSRSYVETSTMLPRPASYLIADHSWIWGDLPRWLGTPPLWWEHQLFVGLGIVVLAAIGASKNRSLLVSSAGWSLALLVAVTLSIAHWSLYRLLYGLPGLDAIRAVTRIFLVMLFPISILVAAGIAALLGTSADAPRQSRIRFGLALGLAALVFVEASALKLNFAPRDELERRVDAVRSQLPAALPDNAILFVATPPQEDAIALQLDTMILAQDMGLATLNGYSGNEPPGNDTRQNRGCLTGADILTRFSIRQHLERAAFQDLAARVVPVGFAACEPSEMGTDRDAFRHLMGETSRNAALTRLSLGVVQVQCTISRDFSTSL